MSNATATEVQTYRWVARGFTQDINQCERCGKPELKGTVRMVAVDTEGDEGETLFMGVVCAAKHAGKRAEEIRHEAKAADAARWAEDRRRSEERSAERIRLRDEWLVANGHDVRRADFETMIRALDWASAQMIAVA